MEKRKVNQYYFNEEFAGQVEGFDKVPAGYINKTVCGCGLTSVAIEKGGNTVIAVPNIVLVQNKVEQYPNKRFDGEVLGVYGGITKDDVDIYISRIGNQPIKILVTYDSLWKVEHLLDECHLIIDESDRLLGSIGLKLQDKKNAEDIDVITYLFNTAEKYKDTVSFISATPIEVELLPEWVSQIEQIELYWANTVKVVPICMKRQHPFSALKNEIIMPLERDGNVRIGDRMITKVIVFMNSVDRAMKLANECKLDKEQVGMICSDNTRNDYKIRGYKRVEVNSELPKYTFITSSGFQGIDLYDNEAINVVVSNTGKDHQMIDLTTDLRQATSRQRDKNNPNYDRYIYIYNQNAFEQSEEELLDIINKSEQEINENCGLLNDLIENEDTRYQSTFKRFNESDEFRTYSIKRDKKWVVNQLAFNADKRFILNTRKQYTKGFNIIANFDYEPIVVERPIIQDDCTYSVLLDMYKKVVNGEEVEFDEYQLASENYQLIDAYYKQAGKFSDNPTYVKEMVLNCDDEWKQLRIEIRSSFNTGHRYSRKEVKDILNQLYSNYGLRRKGNFRDLNDFDIKFVEKKVNGSRMLDIESK